LFVFAKHNGLERTARSGPRIKDVSMNSAHSLEEHYASVPRALRFYDSDSDETDHESKFVPEDRYDHKDMFRESGPRLSDDFLRK
ncbi:hypothetical protein XENOCAPTIV_021160, partial [Xenoophorus captivus]